MIFIRADANAVIATGHIMRCMVIAAWLVKLGEQVTFLVADEFSVDMLDENGFSYIVLDTDWRTMESELPVLRKIIQNFESSILFVDSYQVTEAYFKELSTITKVIYLDDRNAFRCDVFGLINYSHYYHDFKYEETYADSGVRLWLGCGFIPLRDEFCHMEEKDIHDAVQNIMITTGGTDNFNVSEQILKTMAVRFADIKFHLVIGRFYKNRDKLRELASGMKNVILYENISKMSTLMKNCDVAISSGGTTLYELCACGVPTICFSMADNQVPGVKAMAEQGIMLSAGDVRDAEELFGVRVLEHFGRLQDKGQRLAYSRKMQKLVDGKGAERIADMVLKNLP